MSQAAAQEHALNQVSKSGATGLRSPPRHSELLMTRTGFSERRVEFGLAGITGVIPKIQGRTDAASLQSIVGFLAARTLVVQVMLRNSAESEAGRSSSNHDADEDSIGERRNAD